MSEIVTWRGRPLEDYSKEELIEIVRAIALGRVEMIKKGEKPDTPGITPEMIRAGVNFADAQLDGLAPSISEVSLEALVRGVLQIALAASSAREE